jgi:hypothetical protein
MSTGKPLSYAPTSIGANIATNEKGPSIRIDGPRVLRSDGVAIDRRYNLISTCGDSPNFTLRVMFASKAA